MHMEPTRIMQIGNLGRAPAFQPRLRTSFMNPPRTSPSVPQNLLRQTMLGGLGATGRAFIRLGQVGEELVGGPVADGVDQVLERDLAPAGQVTPTQPGPVMTDGSAVLPDGTVITLAHNEDGQPIDVLSAPQASAAPAAAWYRTRRTQLISAGLIATAGAAAGAVHGWKRERSGMASFGWGVLGAAFPLPVVIVAAAQGFGKRKKR